MIRVGTMIKGEPTATQVPEGNGYMLVHWKESDDYELICFENYGMLMLYDSYHYCISLARQSNIIEWDILEVNAKKDTILDSN